MWLLRSGGQRAQTREGDPLLMRPCVCVCTCRKKGKLLGRMIPRGYHLVWDERLECGILKGYKDDKFSGEPKLINLKECVVKTNPRENIPDATLSAPWLDRSAKKKGFCMNIMSPQGAVIKTLWTHSEMEMEEWVADLRKFAVNSAIENGYEIARDNKNSKLGSGSYSVVYLATDRATGQKWAVKEMQKKSLKKEEVDNLRDEVRISQLVGSHDNIVYMKEFVENPQRYYIVLEYLTGGELFDRIVEVCLALPECDWAHVYPPTFFLVCRALPSHYRSTRARTYTQTHTHTHTHTRHRASTSQRRQLRTSCARFSIPSLLQQGELVLTCNGSSLPPLFPRLFLLLLSRYLVFCSLVVLVFPDRISW